MEGVPAEMSLVEGVENVSLPPDGLTFAVSEDDSGMNYAYIIHLPVDAMHVHEQIVTNIIPHEDNMSDETKFIPNAVFTEQSCDDKASNSVLVLPVSTNISCDTNAVSMAPLTTVTANSTTISSSVASTFNASPLESRPIEIQYLEEGVFVHEGEKCDVENLIVDHHQEVPNEEVKFDPLTLTNSDGEPVYRDSTLHDDDEPPDHESVPSSLVGINREEECVQVISNCSDTEDTKVELPEPSSPVIPVSLPASKPVRTYGKRKADSLPPKVAPLLKNTHQPVISEDLVTPITITSLESRQNTTVVSVAEIRVKETQRISIKIPVKKRRLIIDTHKQIPIADFKKQLVNTKDIVRARSELAPGTKEAMKFLEFGGVPQFFSTPGRSIVNVRLARLFTNHLLITGTDEDDPSQFTPLTADLRLSTVSDSRNFSDLTTDSKSTPKAGKRLINASKPLENIFKGLRKAPVLKQYSTLQRKSGIPNGTKKISASLVSSYSRSASVSSEKVKSPSHDAETVQIEEAVYTVEEGESLVLKSHGVNATQSRDAVQACTTVDDLVLITSDTKGEVDSTKNKNSFAESNLISGELSEHEPKLENKELVISAVPDKVLNSSSDALVKNEENKAIDLQTEEALKLWSDEVSSS